MHTLVEILLSNAVLVVVLALIVAGITKFVRRPPVVYALWFLVLLKFVAPPFAPLPLSNLQVNSSPPTTVTVPPLGNVLSSEISEPSVVQESTVVPHVPLPAQCRIRCALPTCSIGSQHESMPPGSVVRRS